jgi:hypothetical protein
VVDATYLGLAFKAPTMGFLGQGMRPFPDAGPDTALDLVESRAFPKGIAMLAYRPSGRPQYVT